MAEIYRTGRNNRSAYIVKFDNGKYIVYCRSLNGNGNPSAHHRRLEDAIADAEHWVKHGRFT